MLTIYVALGMYGGVLAVWAVYRLLGIVRELLLQDNYTTAEGRGNQNSVQRALCRSVVLLF